MQYHPHKLRHAEVFNTRFIRCLSIYRRLQRVPLSVGQLANEYEVSIRTIQRDINALTLAGYGIMPSMDNPRKYTIEAGVKLK